MSRTANAFKAIPTNIISGFLGTGKTTTILSLLENKEGDERWAVLVNEFGEIGIDGAIFQGQHAESGGVFIREVPGGCMCCAGGLPMSTALNQLLKRAKPDRLLIEPTGLGHPKGVLEILCAENYRDVLDIQKTITLVDARTLSDTRYTDHATFNQQIDIADIIVGNKSDLYEEDQESQLKSYVAERKNPETPVVLTDHGNLDPSLLLGSSEVVNKHFSVKRFPPTDDTIEADEEPIPACGYLKKENKGEGFFCVGWRFSPEKQFDLDELFGWFNTLDAKRVKAVLNTNGGAIAYNRVDATASLNRLSDETQESRIEIISRDIDNAWESALMNCLVAAD
ncbi:MAG: GTP-binding protein [Pseudomonadota bacterium]